MGNFNKKTIIKEAENILQECFEKYDQQELNNKVKTLKVKIKKLKRKNKIWQIISACLLIIMLVLIF